MKGYYGKSEDRAYSKKNRRLELRLRPDDAFSKPACGAMHKVSAMLLKMKLNKKRCSDGTVQIEVIPVVLGQIHSSYRFKTKNCIAWGYHATPGTSSRTLYYNNSLQHPK
uniref:Transcription factor IIIC subunit Tfc1/Sfc1 triple barrel domain-containing protein n=1 Tax=Timema poppense TaxID=170557 RepID=A0A7R9DF11_TIMPO|nr:unnamed protein product [Timema poppensis]